MVARTAQLTIVLTSLLLTLGCRGVSLMYEPATAENERPKISMKELTIGTGKTSVKIATDGTFTSNSDETGDLGRTILDAIESWRASLPTPD